MVETLINSAHLLISVSKRGRAASINNDLKLIATIYYEKARNFWLFRKNPLVKLRYFLDKFV